MTMTKTNKPKASAKQPAPITIQGNPANGLLWDNATTAYLKQAMRERGIPIPKTKLEMIGRIKAWALASGARVTLTIG